MVELVDRIINFGLGAVVFTKEKVDTIVNEMVAKGEVTKQQANEISKKLLEKGKQQTDELKSMMFNEIIKTEDFKKVIREEFNKMWEEKKNDN